MRVLPLLLAGAAWAAIAPPARASLVPPVDMPGGEVAVWAGPTAGGMDASLGRLTLGGEVAGAAFGTFLAGYGASARVGWRLWGLPGREPTVGIGATAAVASAGGFFGVWEGWAAQPALLFAFPFGPATLRAAVGPVYFRGVYAGPGGARGGAAGLWPVFPALELAFRIGPWNELVLGGVPEVVAWRVRF